MKPLSTYLILTMHHGEGIVLSWCFHPKRISAEQFRLNTILKGAMSGLSQGIFLEQVHALNWCASPRCATHSARHPGGVSRRARHRQFCTCRFRMILKCSAIPAHIHLWLRHLLWEGDTACCIIRNYNGLDQSSSFNVFLLKNVIASLKPIVITVIFAAFQAYSCNIAVVTRFFGHRSVEGMLT